MVGEGVRRVYVDASALVKLVVAEAESKALVAYFVTSGTQVSSRVVRVEIARAVARVDQGLAGRADEVLGVVEVMELTAAIGDTAAGLAPPTIRTLDAIHIASALALRSEISAFVTYDARLADAARTAGLPVVAPA